MNTSVNFEIAKLLKNKGFPQLNAGLYYTKDKEHCLVGWGFNDRTEESFAQYSAPIIADVVMWLYEKHSIWVNIDIEGENFDIFLFRVYRNHSERVEETIKKIKDENYHTNYNSPTEAYEGAIEYTLKNLI